jgi:biotin carboxyl carrier protein
MTRVLKVKVGSRWFTVEVDDLSTSPIHVMVDGEPVDVEIDGATIEPDVLAPPVPPTPPQAPPSESRDLPAQEVDASENATPSAATAEVRHIIKAPMPGVIISISHAVGGHIRNGDEACVLEAMKMQQSIRSDGEGTVVRILVQPGQQVRGGEPLIELS